MTIVLGILSWLWKGMWGLATNPQGLAIAGIVAFLSYQTGHWRGDSYRNRVWVQKIEAEREKQEQIVTRSDNKALAEITRLSATVELQNGLINDLAAEAAAEAAKNPNASCPAISADGVRRLNRIGPRKAR